MNVSNEIRQFVMIEFNDGNYDNTKLIDLLQRNDVLFEVYKFLKSRKS